MSKYFSYETDPKMACSCCNVKKLDPHVIAVLTLVREHFNEPVIITSGYRCPKHNKAVGGAPKSKHVEGIAVDFKVKGKLPEQVFEYLNDMFPDTYGLGVYSSFVHLDVRKEKARW